MFGIDDVRAAAARLEGVANRTPVLTSRTLDRLVGASVYLKAECYQRGGAFKFRGAFNKLSSLDAAELRRGVVTYSSGNHAQAVAIAAQLVGTTATIIMPTDSPPAKLSATRGYGAEVICYDRYTEKREEIGEALAAERGATLVPPYEDPLVMAGQGTVATELIDEVGDLDVLLVCVGGGGLIAGCATAAKAMVPGIEVYGVEPAVGDDTRQSLAAGRRVEIPVPCTIADGQMAPTP
ncbi:MAG: pyridoxal-phosphate dependent enzyme, partial [Actinomycetota bacterium]|nr:pyridoxal-phosphate dependent enzyme [Actinomycetota bacterium]